MVKLSFHKKSFISREAIRFMLEENLVESEEDGVEKGRLMVEHGLIISVNDEKFKNGYRLFRFSDDQMDIDNEEKMGKVSYIGKKNILSSF